MPPHSSSGHVLLLLRNSKHNDKTWGLPGGNSENDDETLLQTAVREAGEEMGPLPAGYEVKREVLTRWGGAGGWREEEGGVDQVGRCGHSAETAQC